MRARGIAAPLLLAAFVLALSAPALAYRDLSGDAKYAEFFRWLAENRVPHARLVLAETSGKGLGIYAKQPIRPDEPVMRIPLRLLMSQATARQSPRIGHVIRANENTLSKDCVLALHLLDERFNNASFWRPYIQLLPKQFSTLAYFDEEEAEALRGTSVASVPRAMRDLMRREHENMVLPLVAKHPDLFPKKKYTLAAYRWALSVIFSRGMDVVWLGERLRVLTPFSDFLNHAPGIPTAPGMDEMSQSFVMSTPGRAWRSGEEARGVTISYGEQGNGALLQLYGFTMEENPADSVRVDVRVDEQTFGKEKLRILQQRGISKNASFPLFANGSASWDLLFVLRVMQLDPFEMDHGMHEGPAEGRPVSYRNEMEVLASLRRTLESLDAKFETSAEEDRELLKRPLPENIRNAIRVRRGEKLVVQRNLEAVRRRQESLEADPQGLQAAAGPADD
eukprot:tig00020629_g12326.t1